MPLPTPILFEQAKHAHLVQQICQIHRDCILLDHQILGFLPDKHGDINGASIEAFWLAQCTRPTGQARREIVLQMDEDDDQGDGEVLGFVVLDMPYMETGVFRAFVQKLMVSPHHRRQGVARRLLSHVEIVAQMNHRHLLMLDTPVGAPAEQSKMYENAGYKEVGVIPAFGISPKDGSLVDEKFFYKDLRSPKPLADCPALAVL